MAKYTIVLCISVYLVQVINGQCIPGFGLNSNQNLLNISPSLNAGNIQNCASSINVVPSNLALAPNRLGATSLSISSAPYEGILNIVSNSPGSDLPSGITVYADNLEIGGTVAVSGSMPFSGSVNVNGNVPTGGQAALSYSTNSEVALTSSGCGNGLAGSLSPIPSSGPVYGAGALGNQFGGLGYGSYY